MNTYLLNAYSVLEVHKGGISVPRSDSGDGKISTGRNRRNTWGRKFPKCFSDFNIALCTAFIEEYEYMEGHGHWVQNYVN